MKVKGIVIDESVEEQVKFIYPDLIWCKEYDEIDEGEDEYQEACIRRELKLDELTKRYMVGNDDAKIFYFSDEEESIEHIHNVFPEFGIIETDSEEWPFDYDYRNGVNE